MRDTPCFRMGEGLYFSPYSPTLIGQSIFHYTHSFIMNSLFATFLGTAILLAACAGPQSTETAESETDSGAVAATARMYVGTSAPDSVGSLRTIRFHEADGSFTLEHKNHEISGPGFMSLSPDGQRLYAVHRPAGEPEGSVSAFQVDPATGVVTLINSQATKGLGPCYVSTNPEGSLVFVANYSSGSISVFPVAGNGSLEPASDWVQHEGSGANPERQKGPHAHSIRMGPDGKVYANDLGIDLVKIYEVDVAGKLSPSDPPAIQSEPGAGPRHMDFHPNEKWIYVVNELNFTVTRYDAATYEAKQHISTLPEDWEGPSKCADIHVHPNGKFLYASNRNASSSIAAYTIDPASGDLTFVEQEYEGIDWPRNFSIDPSGQYLISSNVNSNTLTSYTIDEATGALTSTGQSIEVPQPMCIVWE